MPCYTTGSAEGDARLDADDARKELTRVTRVACELADAVREAKQAFWSDRLSKETQIWIREHDKIDKARRAALNADQERDRNRKRALKKLTPAERKALGL